MTGKKINSRQLRKPKKSTESDCVSSSSTGSSLVGRKRSLEINERKSPKKTKDSRHDPPEASREKRSYKKVRVTSQPEHDTYCFKCHEKMDDEDIELICSSCSRVYHSSCLSKSSKFNAEGVCFECREISECTKFVAENKISKQILRKAYLIIVNKCFEYVKNEKKSVGDWWTFLMNKEQIFQKVDYIYLIDRAMDTIFMEYQCPAELMNDVHWLYHNTVIVFTKNAPETKAAKELVETFKKEIDSLLDCVICFTKMMNTEIEFHFNEPCSVLHPLVWAKVRSYPYYPAKCYRVSNGKARVRFFHTYQTSTVPVKDCYFYSEEFPSTGNTNSKPKSEMFKKAMEECDEYLEKFTQKYGEYPLRPVKTPYIHTFAEEAMDLLKKRQPSSQYRASGAVATVPPMRSTPTPAVDADEDVKVPRQSIASVINSLNNVSNSINPVYQGRLLPFVSNSKSSTISISNVVSAKREATDDDDELEQEDEIVQPNLTTNSADDDDDSDIEIIEPTETGPSKRRIVHNVSEQVVQAILHSNPDSYRILKSINYLILNVFIQFWGIVNNVKNAPEILSQKENEIHNLKQSMKELMERIFKDEKVREEYQEKLKNAANLITKLYERGRVDHGSIIEEMDKLKIAYDKIINENQKIINENQKIINENQILKSQNENFEEFIKEARLKDYCSICCEPAIGICCYNGAESWKYCSRKCLEIHRKDSCIEENRLQQVEENILHQKSKSEITMVHVQQTLQQTFHRYEVQTMETISNTNNAAVSSSRASTSPMQMASSPGSKSPDEISVIRKS